MNLEEKLQAPFPAEDIEWRIGRSGEKNGKIWATALAYVTNRAIQNRLDEVFGCMNWSNQYKEWHGDSQLCGISVYSKDAIGSITKWDGADGTNFESTKGGLSDSMKRAAVQWGIGRYLYKLDETFVETSASKQNGWKYATTKEKKSFYWKIPDLPTWALPKNTPESTETIPQGKNSKNTYKVSGNQESSLERKFTEQIHQLLSTDELNQYYKSLPADQKEIAVPILAKRKKELSI